MLLLQDPFISPIKAAIKWLKYEELPLKKKTNKNISTPFHQGII
jgi:hypothetical protein